MLTYSWSLFSDDPTAQRAVQAENKLFLSANRVIYERRVSPHVGISTGIVKTFFAHGNSFPARVRAKNLHSCLRKSPQDELGIFLRINVYTLLQIFFLTNSQIESNTLIN